MTTTLRDSEEYLWLLTEAVKDHAIFTMDPHGRITSWNEGAQRLTGYWPEEVLGRHFALLFTAEDRERGLPWHELHTAVESGNAADENWAARKDGSRFWASGTTTALRDDAGRLRGFAKVFRDLTERQQAQEALRESELRLRSALSAARMGTWLWHIPTDKDTLDESLHRLLGVPEGQTVQTLEEFLAFIHPEDRAATAEAFRRSAQEGVRLNVEFRVVRPDGRVRWLKDQGELVRDRQGQPLYLTGACVDITDRKDVEEELERRVEERTAELRRSQERALQTERLAAIGQTVTALAHEGRNALQRAYACLSLLGWRLQGQAEALDLAARAGQALDDLQRLFDDVRGYAAPVQLAPRACNLAEVWRQA